MAASLLVGSLLQHQQAAAQTVIIELGDGTTPPPVPLPSPVYCAPDAAQTGYLRSGVIADGMLRQVQQCDQASGWRGSPVAACSITWLQGDWASTVGADAYDPGGADANSNEAQSMAIASYNGLPVTQASCVEAARNHPANSDGVP
eukprot:SAG22_NODE_9585_length_581_cov_1.026971_1_plen_145_part_10